MCYTVLNTDTQDTRGDPMRFETLAREFKAAYPTGTIDQVARPRKAIVVQFERHGKPYHYRSAIYDIAERLGLIPDYDMHDIAETVARALESGASEYIALSGASDTIRALYGLPRVVESDGGCDEFDRTLSR